MMMSHTYAEAYRRMLYRCQNKECGHAEWLWNSRNGVTPFGIWCHRCEGDALHEEWERDQYLPDYSPFPGERYFVGQSEKPRIVVARPGDGYSSSGRFA